MGKNRPRSTRPAIQRFGACVLFTFVVLPITPLSARGQEGDAGASGSDPPAERPSSLHATDVRASGAGMRIDGALDHPVWLGTSVATDFVQIEPERDEPASDRTEVRVAYDGGAIYIGARLFADPGSIVAPLSRRDDEVTSDWFIVYIDSNGDGATAQAFAVNPRGVTRDFRLLENGAADIEWDAVWSAAAMIDGHGWTAEMRIPLSQLRFDGPDGKGSNGEWGINFERHVTRNGEISTWAPLPRNRRQQVAAFRRVEGLRELSPPLRVELLPYSVAQVKSPTGPGEAPVFGTVGGDLRVGIGSLSLAATFNPDFGQVEADPAVVNVNGYRTFFPEKRPFFLEDQELLSFSIDRTQIFHSRRIGRDVDRASHSRSSLEFVPDASGILAASRLSGRTPGGWSVGVLHALANAGWVESTDSVGVETIEFIEPRTNYFVARIGRDYAEGRKSLGTLLTFTDRALAPDMRGYVSRAVAGGTIWRSRTADGMHEFNGALLGSHIRGDAEAMERIQTAHGRYLQRSDAGHLRYDPGRSSMTGFAGFLEASRVGDDFVWALGGFGLSPEFEVNDLGHQREADVARQYGYIGYDRVGQGWLLRRRRFIANQWSDWSFGAERLSTGVGVEARIQFRNFWTVSGFFEHNLAALSTDVLRGGPAIVVPGTTLRRAILQTDPRRAFNLRIDGSIETEEESKGRTRVLRGALNVRPIPMLALSLEPRLIDRFGTVEYVTRRSAYGDDQYVFGRIDQRTLSVITRADLALSPTFSVQFYAQPYLVERQVVDFSRVLEPRARRLRDRVDWFAPEDVMYDGTEDRYRLPLDGGGESLVFPNPSFGYGQLSSNLVLRWEHSPGSTLFVVWGRDAQFRHSLYGGGPRGGMKELIGVRDGVAAPASHAVMIKLTYWLGL